MKNILSVFAIALILLSATASANDKKPKMAKNQSQTTRELSASAAVQIMEEEFLADLQAYVYKTFEEPARAVGKLNQLQYEVRVYDMNGNLTYSNKAGEYADLPAGAELITVYGGVAYYLQLK